MRLKAKTITKTLSTKLSLMVVGATVVLLLASLGVMLYYSRMAVKDEAMHKASQTLEATILQIDNILLGVEQAVGNTYFSMLDHLDQPDMMRDYCRELVQANPSIIGSAIAFKPYFYKDRELFAACVYRETPDSLGFSDSPVMLDDVFDNRPYTQQQWFTAPMETQKGLWMNPLKGKTYAELPFITFAVPLMGADGQSVAVLGVAVSVSALSHIVLAAKPSPNSYSVLLDGDGTYILHPDTTKLLRQTALDQGSRYDDDSAQQAAEAMVSGQTGYKEFRLGGADYYVFYKPFVRSEVAGRTLERLGWSVGIVFPDDDIYGRFQRMFLKVLGISLVGIVLLLLACRTFVRHELLPLHMLTRSAQRIADGHYDESIPDSRQKDEIGRLQDNFQRMQHSLSSHVSHLEQLNAVLRERGEALRIAYDHAQRADRMKTAVLHNMTNQMMEPANSIDSSVTALCDRYTDLTQAEVDRLADDIQLQGRIITDLLSFLLTESDDSKPAKDAPTGDSQRKEGAHA